jgi:hypothetical protein
MVLFHDVIEILDLADFDRGAMCLIITFDGGFIGLTSIDGNPDSPEFSGKSLSY